MRLITEVLVEFQRDGSASWLAALPVGDAPPDGPRDAIDAAREAGWAEGFAFGEAEREKQRAAVREEVEREVATARAHWAGTEGAALATTLGEGLAALRDTLDAAVAAALIPVMADGLRQRVAGEVVDAIGRLLQGGSDAPLIEVCGPADLVAPIREAFAGRDAVRVTEGGEAELRLTAGDTGAVSQIETWRSRLQASLEGAR